jgi:hypothetical protein
VQSQKAEFFQVAKRNITNQKMIDKWGKSTLRSNVRKVQAFHSAVDYVFGFVNLNKLALKEVFMTGKPISVKFQLKKGSEEAFFAERDQRKLRELREKSKEEATRKYTEEHKYHCFRCGTQSLAEIDEGKVKIDICVNENCGAIHLDPGELKEIIKDQRALSAAKNAFLSVFKK